MLQITIPVTKTFVEYLKSQPMVFEVFGHYQQLQPVGHSAALIGNIQSSAQNKNMQSQEAGGAANQSKQALISNQQHQVIQKMYKTNN